MVVDSALVMGVERHPRTQRSISRTVAWKTYTMFQKRSIDIATPQKASVNANLQDCMLCYDKEIVCEV